MAGLKNNTITYYFEGDTKSLEESIDKISRRFKSLHKKQAENTWDMYNWDKGTVDLVGAYDQLRKSVRGVRKMLTHGQGLVTKQDKEDLKNIRELKKKIEESFANADTLDSKGFTDLEKNMKKALRIAHRLRKRAVESESNYQLKQQKKQDKQAAQMNEALQPEAQAEAYLNTQSFNRIKGYANMSNPQEAAFINDLEQKISTYKQALNDAENAQSEFDSKVVKTKEDEEQLRIAQEKLAKATVEVNNAFKNGSKNLSKIGQRKGDKPQKRNVIKDFGKKLYSQTLRQIASSIISAIINGVKEALAKMAQVSDWFNGTMTEITSSLKYAINSIAAAIAPLLRLVAPVFKVLADLINTVTEKLGKFFAILTGSSTWIKATKQVEDYAEAVNKATGEKGIDELNKLDGSDNPFEEVDIDSTLNVTFNLLSVLDQILADLEPLLNVIFELLDKILEVVGAILMPIMKTAEKVLKPIVAVITSILDLIILVIDQLMKSLNPFTESFFYLLADIGTLIAHVILALMPLIEPILQIICAVVDVIASVLGDIIDLVDFLIQILDPVLSTVIIGVAGAFGVILSVVAQIVYLVGAIVKTVAKLFTFQWNEIPSVWSNFASMSQNLWAGWGKTFMSSADGIYGTMTVDTSRMATGGVVSAPTLAMVGEGKYSEAVVPLGQSPQFASMQEGIAEAVVSRLSAGSRSGSSGQPVVLNIDGKTLARALWPSLEKTQYQVGVKLK